MPGKVTPLDVFHRDVAGVLLHHRVEDRHDMRMPQVPGERSLVLALRAVPRAEFGIPEYFGLDRLERDFTPGEGILGKVHHSGRALAERSLNVVLADLKTQAHLNGRFQHTFSRPRCGESNYGDDCVISRRKTGAGGFRRKSAPERCGSAERGEGRAPPERAAGNIYLSARSSALGQT